MTHESQSSRPSSTTGVEKPARLVSLDAFRGLIMMTLAAKGFGVVQTAKRLGHWPESTGDNLAAYLWNCLAFHTSHPPWNSQFYIVGCSYWDLVQVAFMFMVGVAMPYSYAGRRARGDSPWMLTRHAAIRAVVLVLLGMFLQTRGGGGENRLLTNVLSQIGLGYFLVYLLLGRSVRVQLAMAIIVLVGYWALMITWPVPDELPKKAAESIEGLSLAFAELTPHFAKHADVGSALDRWLLGTVNPGGFATLNFIPSAVTMLMGVMAGQLLRGSGSDCEKLRRLLASGFVCMTLAIVASYTVCPIIKRNWTPAFTLHSGAWVLWMLALFYWVIDLRGWKRWTFPLVVIGMNSLAMYLMGMLLHKWTAERLQVYLGESLFAGPYGPTIEALGVFAVFWLTCWYMYRNRLFLRI